ncbi:MAG TPA: MerR family DNA-binding transcriptional regulator [Solirubrobacteraceae bacterium]|jgi:DNA-binding transcriptional MerR regulator|nr:MerR family DNA-binding transcriptional regulator [Solirubrobacteraceae bacterium]
MSTVRTNAAAEMLGVSPNTLRSWERRFGYPKPRRTQGGHRQFELPQIEALRQAFSETHNISSAIGLARERGEGPSTSTRLQSAFAAFDEDKAGRLLEESLAVRSVERTVEEILLPGVEAVAGEEPPTPELQFAWRFATGWLAASQRVAAPAHRPDGVLLFDASRLFDVDALHAQALELALRRGGLRTLTLSVELDPARLARALRALHPRAVVLTGRRASMDTLGRLVFAARRGEQPVEVFDYRGALPDTGASTVARLGSSPLAARDVVLDALANAERSATQRPAAGHTGPRAVTSA